MLMYLVFSPSVSTSVSTQVAQRLVRREIGHRPGEYEGGTGEVPATVAVAILLTDCRRDLPQRPSGHPLPRRAAPEENEEWLVQRVESASLRSSLSLRDRVLPEAPSGEDQRNGSRGSGRLGRLQRQRGVGSGRLIESSVDEQPVADG
jgi:hypothetical protein